MLQTIMAYIHIYVRTHIYIAGMQVLKKLGIEVDVCVSSVIDQDAVKVSYVTDVYLALLLATYVAYNF